jgi:hypothetical protein
LSRRAPIEKDPTNARHTQAFRRICECVRYPSFIAAPLVLIGLLSVAPASAKPHPPVLDPGATTLAQFDPVSGSGYCDGFAVVFEYTKLKQKYVNDTRDANGVGTFKVTGNAQATVTNTVTGKSIGYNVSGPGTVVVNEDFSFSVDAHGPNLFYTERKNLSEFPDVPAISYTTGHLTFAVAASGQTTSYTLTGNRTDVCAVLAS